MQRFSFWSYSFIAARHAFVQLIAVGTLTITIIILGELDISFKWTGGYGSKVEEIEVSLDYGSLPQEFLSLIDRYLQTTLTWLMLAGLSLSVILMGIIFFKIERSILMKRCPYCGQQADHTLHGIIRCPECGKRFKLPFSKE